MFQSPPTRKHVFVSCEFFNYQQNVDRTSGLPAIVQNRESYAQPKVVILQASMEIQIKKSHEHRWKLCGIVWNRFYTKISWYLTVLWLFIPYNYISICTLFMDTKCSDTHVPWSMIYDLWWGIGIPPSLEILFDGHINPYWKGDGNGKLHQSFSRVAPSNSEFICY